MKKLKRTFPVYKKQKKTKNQELYVEPDVKMQKLGGFINYKNLVSVLRKKGYKSFVDEQGRLIDVSHISMLFPFKYEINDWSFLIVKSSENEDFLSCCNCCRFEYRFPLRK